MVLPLRGGCHGGCQVGRRGLKMTQRSGRKRGGKFESECHSRGGDEGRILWNGICSLHVQPVLRVLRVAKVATIEEERYTAAGVA